jgi:hypothetical protein
MNQTRTEDDKAEPMGLAKHKLGLTQTAHDYQMRTEDDEAEPIALAQNKPRLTQTAHDYHAEHSNLEICPELRRKDEGEGSTRREGRGGTMCLYIC